MPRPLIKRTNAKINTQSATDDCTALYIRVSTEKQASEGFSLSAQDLQLRNYCAVFGWLVCDHRIYVDAGISGKSTNRDAFLRMMQDARNGEVKRVVACKLDRLARNTKDFLQVVDQLQKCGCDLVLIKESFDTSTPQGKFALTMFAAIAELEASTIAERVMTGKAQKARQGGYNGAYCPFGYIFNDGKFEVDIPRAQIVNRIFNMFVIEEESLTAIADKLNVANIKTGRGGKWRANTIRYMLRNGFYAGLAQWGTVETSGTHQPIISMDTYEKAHNRLLSLKPGPA